MAQPSVTQYFNSRKRSAADDLCTRKSKVIHLEDGGHDNQANFLNDKKVLLNDLTTIEPKASPRLHANTKNKTVSGLIADGRKTIATRRRSCIKRSDPPKAESNQPKIVRFTLAGALSPKKKQKDDAKLSAVFGNLENVVRKEVDLHTPTKEQQLAEAKAEQDKQAVLNMSLGDIKKKIIKSDRLKELKESLSKLRSMEESRQKCIKQNGSVSSNFERDPPLPPVTQKIDGTLGANLKKFDHIELEVLSSPKKGLCTPTKPMLASPFADGRSKELMSPVTPRRLFSPTKESPTKALPAYQRFQSLTESGRPTLQLPYKYRCLAETFKCVDTVCSMFFNRREAITMKKLKPAVQRMMRKNFSETSLAQINHLYPEAYKFSQKKTSNPGSLTKYDYYQLVIIPNVTESSATVTSTTNTDDIIKSGQQKSMNPQVMIERQQHFHKLLLDMVKDEHYKFLQNLNPPMNINPDKVTRWHPEFDLQSCPDVAQKELPQPPNVEKFSSAKDILSTARNLFDCATPKERMMQRYEAKQKLEKKPELVEPKTYDPVANVLKGVPKSLIERIRARQAAKALDSMTRRPSQDQESNNFARLPDLARHIRNIFVTESKGVLDLDFVLTKLENSYRERIPRNDMKDLLQLLAKETPTNWLTFPHLRDRDFLKVNKSVDLTEIIKQLEAKAEEKR
ncbi:hypothetical protein HA402_001479 [Bradysia odoriphaga]|nr:hypothetical protein HA402_001479 [Bradysia odoriphaga]